MRKFMVWIFLCYVAELWGYVGLCCGKCGGNMPLVFPGAGVPETHEWRFKVTPFRMKMEGLLQGEDDISFSQGLDNYMMVPTEMEMDMYNLSLGYTPNVYWSVMLMAMYMRKDMEMINRMNQKSEMKSEGWGDLMLMAKRILKADDLLIPSKQWSVLMGVSLPTGSINERNQKELLPYSMQLGSGTFDPILGIQYGRKKDPYWWGGSLRTHFRVQRNNKGYRRGHRTHIDLYWMKQLREDLVFEILAEGMIEGRLRGEAIETLTQGVGHMNNNPSMGYMSSLWDPANYGRKSWLLSAGVQWQPAPYKIFEIFVGKPVYQDVDGIQMETDWRVGFTFYVEILTEDSRRYHEEKETEDEIDDLGF